MKVIKQFEVHNLGSVLKATRLDKKLTREQLSEKVGIGYRHLMGIENKNKTPGFNVLFRLIRELGIPADMIFYPERDADNSEKEQLVRIIQLCGDKEIRAVRALVDALLDSGK